jgi:O-antigen/teichoic acid export membrane protein
MKAIRTLIDRHPFAWDSGLLVASGAAAGLLYMVVQAVLGRMMNAVDYGQVVALLGLLNVLSLPSASMELTIARYVAEHAHHKSVSLWVTLFKRALRRVGKYVGAGFLVWILLSGILKNFFDAPSILSIVLLGLIAVIRLFMPIVSGALQGGRSFGWLAGVGMSTALFRLIFCTAAVWIGMRTDGVLGAIALSTACSLFLGLVPFRRVMADTPAVPDYDTRPIYRYLWPVLVGQGAFLLLMNADVMMSARFLAPEDLAVYGKASMLSRIVLFLPQPVSVAMFPRAVTSSRRLFFIAPLLFALATSVAAALALSLFPEIFLRAAYGVDGGAYADIMALYVWAALPLTLVGILTRYLWARHRTGRALILAPVVALYLGALFLFHETPGQMIACLAAGGTCALVALLGAAFAGRTRRGPPDEGAG